MVNTRDVFSFCGAAARFFISNCSSISSLSLSLSLSHLLPSLPPPYLSRVVCVHHNKLNRVVEDSSLRGLQRRAVHPDYIVGQHGHRAGSQMSFCVQSEKCPSCNHTHMKYFHRSNAQHFHRCTTLSVVHQIHDAPLSCHAWQRRPKTSRQTEYVACSQLSVGCPMSRGNCRHPPDFTWATS